MKHLLLLVLLICAPAAHATHATGNDDSDQASYTASCNASFQVDCPDAALVTSSVAAPIGSIGDSLTELIVVLLALSMFLLRTRRLHRRSLHTEEVR